MDFRSIGLTRVLLGEHRLGNARKGGMIHISCDNPSQQGALFGPPFAVQAAVAERARKKMRRDRPPNGKLRLILIAPPNDQEKGAAGSLSPAAFRTPLSNASLYPGDAQAPQVPVVGGACTRWGKARMAPGKTKFPSPRTSADQCRAKPFPQLIQKKCTCLTIVKYPSL
jgi:hypothetical protein